MTSNDIVRKVTFTGSTEVGRIPMRQSADTIKKWGWSSRNAPLIIFVADIEVAVRGETASKFRNAGQTGRATGCQKWASATHSASTGRKGGAMKVGDGAEDGVAIGPLIDAQGLEKVRHVEYGWAALRRLSVAVPMLWRHWSDRADRHDHRYGDLC